MGACEEWLPLPTARVGAVAAACIPLANAIPVQLGVRIRRLPAHDPGLKTATAAEMGKVEALPNLSRPMAASGRCTGASALYQSDQSGRIGGKQANRTAGLPRPRQSRVNLRPQLLLDIFDDAQPTSTRRRYCLRQMPADAAFRAMKAGKNTRFTELSTQSRQGARLRKIWASALRICRDRCSPDQERIATHRLSSGAAAPAMHWPVPGTRRRRRPILPAQLGIDFQRRPGLKAAGLR